MDASRFDHLTRHLGSRLSRRTALGIAATGLVLSHPDHVSAQEATAEATPSPGEKPVFLFVQTFASGRGDLNPAAGTPTADGTPVPGGGANFLLTLEGHSGQTIYFSDRPDRIVGAVPTQDFLDGLGFTPENPPNAALVAEFQAGQGVVVLELMTPAYDAETGVLTYGAEALDAYEGQNLDAVTGEQLAERLPAEFGPAALFIDDCPDVTGCYKAGWPGDYKLGSIPGGPYGRCWQGMFQGGCDPCSYTWDELNDICTDAYFDECGHSNIYCYAGPQTFS